MSMFRRRLLMQKAQYMSLPEPIAKYEAYNRTNESDGREILTDLTGNGNDIQLYNFGYALGSGYGLYTCRSFTQSGSNMSGWNVINSYTLNGKLVRYFTGYWQVGSESNTIFNFTLKISGIPDNNKFFIQQYNASNYAKQELKNGINKITIDLTESTKPNYPYLQFNAEINSETEVTIEIIPDYPGALVSDGVDDYGLCSVTNNLGSVLMLLKPVSSDNNGFILNYGSNDNRLYISSIGSEVLITSNTEPIINKSTTTPFIYITRKGVSSNNKNLSLFGLNGGSNAVAVALYALEIYDRDLTDSEINAVKTRMLKKYNNQEDTTSDWYGIEWYTNQSSSAVTRIGNVNLHKSIPIQSGMYRCVLNDNGEEVYKLDPNDSTKKEDGTAAVLDGTDGQVMVRIPVFYAKFETQGYRRRVMLSSRSKSGFKKMGGCYVSAYESTIDRTTSDTPKLASVVNTTANFRGGNNTAEWDSTYRSLLGMPATATSLTNFRVYARNRNNGDTQWNCMDYTAYKAIYWLYVVEYANLNSQLDFNDELTAEGYRQGGLGAGVTNINDSKWNAFNGYYPFIPCGYTNSLGNKTGVVAFTMPDEYDAETPFTTYVPSYRGIENPFGHLWKWTDGIHIKVQSEEAGGKSILYTSNNPANYQDTDYDGYEEKGEIARANGYVKKILFGDDGDIIVSKDGNTGGSSTTYFCDYFYTNIPSSGEVLRSVLFGGIAVNGAFAGFASAYSVNAPSLTAARIGSRLCYIPNNN